MSDSKFRDALGNPIVIGNTYGWSNNQSGFTYITIGEALRETSKKVSLKVLERKVWMYDNPHQVNWGSKSGDTVSVRALSLFPVNPKDIKL